MSLIVRLVLLFWLWTVVSALLVLVRCWCCNRFDRNVEPHADWLRDKDMICQRKVMR
jgi:hypothetical protein